MYLIVVCTCPVIMTNIEFEVNRSYVLPLKSEHLTNKVM